MIFAKKSAKSLKQQDFHLNNNKLDIVQEYTYLGVKLSSTGNFTTNQSQSREKASARFLQLNAYHRPQEIKTETCKQII